MLNFDLPKLFNPFVPNAPFLCPLKKSENLKVFWCFEGIEKGCIGDKWIKNEFSLPQQYPKQSSRDLFMTVSNTELFAKKVNVRNYFRANPKKSHFLLTSNKKVNLNLDDLIIKNNLLIIIVWKISWYKYWQFPHI